MIPSSTLGLDDMIGALCVSPDRHRSNYCAIKYCS